MTRLELIRLLLGQAKKNGFQFRRWYTSTLGAPWRDSQHATARLAEEKRYYSLLFSHEFARNFWKAGETITFLVEKQTFQRTAKDGSTRTVHRKPYMRRTGRPEVWRYHLKEMALAEEPLRYIRRYVHTDEELELDSAQGKAPSVPRRIGSSAAGSV